MSTKQPLFLDSDNDYIFEDTSTFDSVWITVGNVSVYIIRRWGEGVEVHLYPKGREAEDAIDKAVASFEEVEALLEAAENVEIPQSGGHDDRKIFL